MFATSLTQLQTHGPPVADTLDAWSLSPQVFFYWTSNSRLLDWSLSLATRALRISTCGSSQLMQEYPGSNPNQWLQGIPSGEITLRCISTLAPRVPHQDEAPVECRAHPLLVSFPPVTLPVLPYQHVSYNCLPVNSLLSNICPKVCLQGSERCSYFNHTLFKTVNFSWPSVDLPWKIYPNHQSSATEKNHLTMLIDLPPI